MADSLEANFALDSDTEQQSASIDGGGGPSNGAARGKKRRLGDGVGRSDDDDDNDNGDVGTRDDGGGKRERGGSEEMEAMQLAAGASSAQKKARRKARTKARKARMAQEAGAGVGEGGEGEGQGGPSSSSSTNPALLPASSQVDYLRKEMRKASAWKDLSELELAERGIGEGEVVESMIAWKESREVDDLSNFVRRFAILPKFVTEERETPTSSLQESRTSGRFGAPAVLVLTNNALRAAHIARQLRTLLLPPKGSKEEGTEKQGKESSPSRKKVKNQPDQLTKDKTQHEIDGEAGILPSAKVASPQIAKLFSRHFTPAQQVSFLESHRVLAGAGTPQRIALLLSKTRQGGRQQSTIGTTIAIPSPDDDDQTTTTDELTGLLFALDLSNLTTLVLDAGWKDEKMRCLLDERDAREGLVEIWDKIRQRCKRGKVRVILF